MTLQNWLDTLDRAERVEFAQLAGTTHNYVCYQVANGHSRPSVELALRLVEASRRMFPKRRKRWLTLDIIYAKDAAA